MIKIENVEVTGWKPTIRGMKNLMNSRDKSDSGICKGGDDGIGCKNCANQESCHHAYNGSWQLGKADHELMMKLAKAGSVHGKFRRMITVYVDITAPLYWWKEFDTYKRRRGGPPPAGDRGTAGAVRGPSAARVWRPAGGGKSVTRF